MTRHVREGEVGREERHVGDGGDILFAIWKSGVREGEKCMPYHLSNSTTHTTLLIDGNESHEK